MDAIEIRRRSLGVYENPDDPTEISCYTRVWYSDGTDLTYLDTLTRTEDGKQVSWTNTAGHSPAAPVRH